MADEQSEDEPGTKNNSIVIGMKDVRVVAIDEDGVTRDRGPLSYWIKRGLPPGVKFKEDDPLRSGEVDGGE